MQKRNSRSIRCVSLHVSRAAAVLCLLAALVPSPDLFSLGTQLRTSLNNRTRHILQAPQHHSSVQHWIPWHIPKPQQLPQSPAPLGTLPHVQPIATSCCATPVIHQLSQRLTTFDHHCRSSSHERATGGLAAALPLRHDQDDEGECEDRPPHRLAGKAGAAVCTRASTALHC